MSREPDCVKRPWEVRIRTTNSGVLKCGDKPNIVVVGAKDHLKEDEDDKYSYKSMQEELKTNNDFNLADYPGAIVGIVIGSVFICILMAFCFHKQMQKDNRQSLRMSLGRIVDFWGTPAYVPQKELIDKGYLPEKPIVRPDSTKISPEDKLPKSFGPRMMFSPNDTKKVDRQKAIEREKMEAELGITKQKSGIKRFLTPRDEALKALQRSKTHSPRGLVPGNNYEPKTTGLSRMDHSPRLLRPVGTPRQIADLMTPRSDRTMSRARTTEVNGDEQAANLLATLKYVKEVRANEPKGPKTVKEAILKEYQYQTGHKALPTTKWQAGMGSSTMGAFNNQRIL